MIKGRRQLLAFLFLVTDLLATVAAWVTAYLVRFQSGWVPLESAAPPLQWSLRRLPQVLVLGVVAYRFAGQYAIDRLRRLREEFAAVIKGTTILMLLVLAFIFFRHDRYESRTTIVVFSLLNVIGILTARRVGWAIIRTLRSHGFNQSFALVVGTGRVARKIARSLRRTTWMGINVVGFVEDKPNRLCADLALLGRFGDLPELIRKYRIGHVFIALPMNRYDDARRVFAILSQELVDVRLVADVPNLAGLTLTTSNFDGLPIVGLRESPHFGLNLVVKRAMDIMLSLLALIFLGPLMILIAVLVKLTSPGPVFYRQERCGLNGRTFSMLKFRSMRVDAEQQTGAVWAQKDDPRRTRFGTFLRQTSLDELPQFINVLRGDMSLVGPRPERPVFIQKFTKTIPSYMARHCVKAGITGWAQVHGWRGNTSLRKRLQYDLYYITHWTPWLDFRILWMTVLKGLVNRNAY
jgi:Undecaprenyl-phosphate glucose phosphotransferase